jgi:hypothetical protein
LFSDGGDVLAPRRARSPHSWRVPGRFGPTGPI